MSGWQHAAAVHRSVIRTEQALVPRLEARIAELERQLAEQHELLAKQQASLPQPRPPAAATVQLPSGEPPIQRRRPSVRWLKELVAGDYAVTVLDIESSRRQRSVLIPRQIVMYLARKFTGLSLGSIGQFIGGRDHTTIIHGADKIKIKRQVDSDLDERITKLEQEIEAAFNTPEPA